MSANLVHTPHDAIWRAADDHTVVVGTTRGGGISPAGHVEWLRSIASHGHAVTYVPAAQPTVHRVIGEGVGHDDAAFCERRDRDGSFAAYIENDRASRWWEDTDTAALSYGVTYYGCAARNPRATHNRTESSRRLAEMSGVA